MDILVYLSSILLLAGLIPVLLAAGYLRTRRRGYRPPGALLVLLVGIGARIWKRIYSHPGIFMHGGEREAHGILAFAGRQ